MPGRTRRATLAALSGVALAGCSGFTNAGPPNKNDLPDQCPTSLELDVQWPRDLDPGPVRGFVSGYQAVDGFALDYERAYLTQNDTGSWYDPGDSTQIDQEATKLSDGFHVTVRSSGSSENQRMLAFHVDSDGIPWQGTGVDVVKRVPPDGPKYISIDQIEDRTLRDVLQSAADSSHGDHSGSVSQIEEYADLIETFSPSVEINDMYQTGAYFDVDGTHVLLVIEADPGSVSHYEITAQYYVTERIVRRTEEHDESAKNGELLECRPPE